MLKRRIVRIGNSYGITIPPAVLQHMGVEHGDTVGVILKKVSK